MQVEVYLKPEGFEFWSREEYNPEFLKKLENAYKVDEIKKSPAPYGGSMTPEARTAIFMFLGMLGLMFLGLLFCLKCYMKPSNQVDYSREEPAKRVFSEIMTSQLSRRSNEVKEVKELVEMKEDEKSVE